MIEINAKLVMFLIIILIVCYILSYLSSRPIKLNCACQEPAWFQTCSSMAPGSIECDLIEQEFDVLEENLEQISDSVSTVLNKLPDLSPTIPEIKLPRVDSLMDSPIDVIESKSIFQTVNYSCKVSKDLLDTLLRKINLDKWFDAAMKGDVKALIKLSQNTASEAATLLNKIPTNHQVYANLVTQVAVKNIPGADKLISRIQHIPYLENLAMKGNVAALTNISTKMNNPAVKKIYNNLSYARTKNVPGLNESLTAMGNGGNWFATKLLANRAKIPEFKVTGFGKISMPNNQAFYRITSAAAIQGPVAGLAKQGFTIASRSLINVAKAGGPVAGFAKSTIKNIASHGSDVAKNAMGSAIKGAGSAAKSVVNELGLSKVGGPVGSAASTVISAGSAIGGAGKKVVNFVKSF